MYEIVVCLRVNDILDVLNCSNMSILLRKCFLDTETKGLMPEDYIGMNYGAMVPWRENSIFKALGVAREWPIQETKSGFGWLECREQRG